MAIIEYVRPEIMKCSAAGLQASLSARRGALRPRAWRRDKRAMAAGIRAKYSMCIYMYATVCEKKSQVISRLLPPTSKYK